MCIYSKRTSFYFRPVIEGLEINQVDPNTGYSVSGTRNVSACIENNTCPFGNYDTSDFAQKK